MWHTRHTMICSTLSKTRPTALYVPSNNTTAIMQTHYQPLHVIPSTHANIQTFTSNDHPFITIYLLIFFFFFLHFPPILYFFFFFLMIRPPPKSPLFPYPPLFRSLDPVDAQPRREDRCRHRLESRQRNVQAGVFDGRERFDADFRGEADHATRTGGRHRVCEPRSEEHHV